MSNLRWGLGIRHDHPKESVARDTILEAARRCYARHGLSVTGDDIATEAKISRPTMYHYFDGVEKIRMSVVRNIWRQLKPEHGSAVEWANALRAMKEFRLGLLCLSMGPLFADLETAVLCEVQSVQEEAVARLLLSYLKIDALTGDPLPVFEALLMSVPG